MTQSASLRIYSTLSAVEQDLILEFVTSSGSLKALAESHGVSYPTIRARLDRLIARIEELSSPIEPDKLAHKLADLVEAGQILPQAARDILDEHRRILQRAVNAQESSS